MFQVSSKNSLDWGQAAWLVFHKNIQSDVEPSMKVRQFQRWISVKIAEPVRQFCRIVSQLEQIKHRHMSYQCDQREQQKCIYSTESHETRLSCHKVLMFKCTIQNYFATSPPTLCWNFEHLSAHFHCEAPWWNMAKKRKRGRKPRDTPSWPKVGGHSQPVKPKKRRKRASPVMNVHPDIQRPANQ